MAELWRVRGTYETITGRWSEIDRTQEADSEDEAKFRAIKSLGNEVHRVIQMIATSVKDSSDEVVPDATQTWVGTPARDGMYWFRILIDGREVKRGLVRMLFVEGKLVQDEIIGDSGTYVALGGVVSYEYSSCTISEMPYDTSDD